MRILHLNTYDLQGGAARAAQRLHAGLRNLQHDSRMLVCHKTSNQEQVIPAELQILEQPSKLAQRILLKGNVHNRTPASNTHFSLPEPSWDISRHPEVQASQILNLHWVAEFVSLPSLARLARTGRPVVWTLHDQRPFTGGCHFSAGCQHYQIECGRCPQLQRFSDRLPRAVLADARNALRKAPLTIVSPSRWLADCAKQSALFRNSRIEVIPYGLDTRVFCPQAQARREHELPANAVVLLFGADCVRERRKGFQALTAGLSAAMENRPFREAIDAGRVMVACFGDPDLEQPPSAVPIRNLGRVTSDAALARIYSAADAVLLPSLEDNLPNVMLEAMCCGTPVLAHQVGGVSDVIVNDHNGLLVPANNPGLFGAALRQLASDRALRERLAAACRNEMPSLFSLKVQAERYLALYEELLANHASPKVRSSHPVCPAGKWGRQFRAAAKHIIRAGKPPRFQRFLQKLGWPANP